MADDAAGGVLVYVGLVEDGGAGGADGGGGVQLRSRSAAGEGDEGVAPVEAGVGAGDGVATDVVDRVDGVAHRAGSVVWKVWKRSKVLKVLKVLRRTLCVVLSELRQVNQLKNGLERKGL